MDIMQTYIYKTADGYEVRCDEPKFTLRVDNLAMAEAFRGTIDFVIFAKNHAKPPKPPEPPEPPEPFAYLLVWNGKIVDHTRDKRMTEYWEVKPNYRIVPVYEDLP